MALHPQARELLDMVEESGLPPLNELSPPAAREQAGTLRALIGDGPHVARVENFAIAGRETEIPARRYEPDDAAATIFWIHGGGWVIGDLESHDAMCRLLANESGCRVIAIDYRRAPEHPFPAPLEDSWDALRWSAETYGTPLILGGDSAGGNMAAVLARRARDRGGGPELVFQALVYPVTDHVFTTPSYLQHGSGRDTFLTSDEMQWFWNHYLPDERARDNPDASPLRADDLSGLPATIVMTAGYDPLRDEGLAYAERLRAAGVTVSHHHYDDMIHAFFTLVNLLDRGNEAVALLAAEIRAAVTTAATPA